MTIRILLRPGRARLVLTLSLALAPVAAVAAPEEIEVYRDDVTPYRALGLEVNQNYVFAGSREDQGDGAFSPIGLYRLTPEVDYGFARRWEVGALVEATVRDGAFDAHGAEAHVRYVAPRPEGSPWYWGFNFETGFTDRHLEERPFTAELRGIGGYEGRHWILAFNPTFETSANTQGATPVAFELQAKLGYRVTDRLILGVESYNEFGPVKDFGPLGREPQTLYAAADYEWRGMDFNLGLGRGLTNASDGWTVKAAIAVSFGRR